MIISDVAQQVAAATHQSTTVISAAGTLNSSVSSILSSAFGAPLIDPALSDTPPSTDALVHVAHVPSVSSSVLTVDAIDDARASELDIDDALTLTTALSSVSVYTVDVRDLSRATATGLPRIVAAAERAAAFQSTDDQLASIPTDKRLVVAVNGFDPADGATEEDVTARVQDILASQQSFTSVDVCVLPDSRHSDKSSYDAGLTSLKDAVSGALPSEGVKAEELAASVQSLESTLSRRSDAAADAGDELGATFRCDASMRGALGKFRAKLKLWRASIDAGRVIQNFGSETDKLMRRVVSSYEEDSAAFRMTDAFTRKRNELQQLLLSDAYILFSKQLLKLRENAYQIFRSKLARIRINDAVERNIRSAIADAEAHFVRNVLLIRCSVSAWRFDNERLELVNHMRNDSMERLQLAKLQGNYVPNIRIPVAFAFHTLLASPFGKDSRVAAQQSPVDEMKTSYDPDKMKQPSMMRTRAFQRGHGQKVSRKDMFSEEGLESIAPFYEADAGPSK